jgi:hypothetical protein
MLLMAAAFVLVDMRGRTVMAGAAAGLATIIKVYPVVLFAGFLFQRRWLAIVAGVAVMALIAAASLVSYGSADWLSFVGVHATKGASAAFIYADPARRFLEAPNYSFTHVLYMWALSAGTAPSGKLVADLARGSLVLGCIAFLWYFRRQLWQANSLVLWCHAVLLFFLPFSVVFWNHIFVFYLPGIVLTGVALASAREVPAGLWIGWIAGVALMGLVDYAPNLGFFNRAPLFIFKPLKFYGLVIHAIAFGWMLRDGLLAAPSRVVEARA